MEPSCFNSLFFYGWTFWMQRKSYLCRESESHAITFPGWFKVFEVVMIWICSDVQVFWNCGFLPRGKWRSPGNGMRDNSMEILLFIFKYQTKMTEPCRINAKCFIGTVGSQNRRLCVYFLMSRRPWLLSGINLEFLLYAFCFQ